MSCAARAGRQTPPPWDRSKKCWDGNRNWNRRGNGMTMGLCDWAALIERSWNWINCPEGEIWQEGNGYANGSAHNSTHKRCHNNRLSFCAPAFADIITKTGESLNHHPCECTSDFNKSTVGFLRT